MRRNQGTLKTMIQIGYEQRMEVEEEKTDAQEELASVRVSVSSANSNTLSGPLLTYKNSEESTTTSKKTWGGKYCPGFSRWTNQDKYRVAFFGNAPDFSLRLFQLSIFFFGLFTSMFISIFIFIPEVRSLWWNAVLFPFITFYVVGKVRSSILLTGKSSIKYLIQLKHVR